MSTVTGWGRPWTSVGGVDSKVLLEVAAKVTSECFTGYCSGDECGKVTDNMLCAKDSRYDQWIGGMCPVDSGSPLVTCGPDGNCGTTTGKNYDLIGIASWNIACPLTNPFLPRVFSRVTAARQWIDDNAPGWESGTCPRV